MNQIGAECDCDVVASDDDTGHAALGGDWDLEYSVVEIETTVAFSDALQDNWSNLLNVTVDSTSTGTIAKDNSSTSFSHTTSGTDRLMLVAISFGEDSDESVSSMTYNGTTLTLVGVVETDKPRVEIWSLVAPVTGTHTVAVTTSASGHSGAAIGVMTFNDVHQPSPLESFFSSTGDSSTASVTSSSASDHLVFAAVAIEDGSKRSLSSGAGQTERWDLFADDKANGGGSTETGAGSVTTSWTWGSSDKWVIGGVSIRSTTSDTIASYQEGTAPKEIELAINEIRANQRRASFVSWKSLRQFSPQTTPAGSLVLRLAGCPDTLLGLVFIEGIGYQVFC
jgi:hypothetical protein